MNELAFSPVIAEVIAGIVKEAGKRGKYLHRYQTNTNGRHGVRITYAMHTASEPRPSRSDKCDGQRECLYHREGTTERCWAFRKLNCWLTMLRRESEQQEATHAS